MAIVVFDASVLIAFLSRRDSHHHEAAVRVRATLAPGIERWLCAVTLSEILVGPIRAGRDGEVHQMLGRLGIEIRSVDATLARRAAAVRAGTDLAIPDAYVLATLIAADERSAGDVRLESFDERLLKARARLAAAPTE